MLTLTWNIHKHSQGIYLKSYCIACIEAYAMTVGLTKAALVQGYPGKECRTMEHLLQTLNDNRPQLDLSTLAYQLKLVSQGPTCDPRLSIPTKKRIDPLPTPPYGNEASPWGRPDAKRT